MPRDSETRKASQAKYREANREKLRAYNKNHSLQIKLKVLEYYGGKCVECGLDDFRALQIDHINDDGAEHRKSLGGQNFSGKMFYAWIVKNNFPDDLQILCANHNQIKQWMKNNPPVA